MFKILLIITAVLLFLPVYLYAGKEILEFLQNIGKETNYDFEKPFWKKLIFFLNIVWLPVLYVILHILIIVIIGYNGYIFYKNIKLDIKTAWWELKNNIFSRKQENPRLINEVDDYEISEQ